MRIDDSKTFKYVLKRQVSPLSANLNDQNAVHFACLFDKIHFLSYLFEADFEAYHEEDEEERYLRIVHNLTVSKHHWVYDALVAIDRCTLNKGVSPLHLALKCDSEGISLYLIKVAQVRERIKNEGLL